MSVYITWDGKIFPYSHFSFEQLVFLRDVMSMYQKKPNWRDFSESWVNLGKETIWKKELRTDSIYRICEDLTTKLGIEQEKIEAPNGVKSLHRLMEYSCVI
jgi:hypothetical protein